MTLCVGPDQLDRAAAALRAGQLVAFPTETVYGLGANALDERAVARVFEAKGRPRFDPLIVHVADAADARRFAAEWPAAAQRLAEAFWPGPVTVVVKKFQVPSSRFQVQQTAAEPPDPNLKLETWNLKPIPDLVTAGLPTVALRVPRHPVALELIRRAGVPVAAPSANPFGAVSPTRAEHVRAGLGEKVDVLVDGGPCETGVESTVVSVVGVGEGGVTVLRLGGLAVERIEQVVGPVTVAVGDEAANEAEAVQAGRQSPGMLARHYAPRARLVVVEAGFQVPSFKFQVEQSGARRVGVLMFRRRPDVEEQLGTWNLELETLSPQGELTEAAANLFAALHRLDAAGVDLIVAELAPEQGLGRAINDRLRRAAAGRADG
ncbi:MAG: L-threonylcarbamoyladenylate synthase [Phycisphaeraceae bacterium]